ncbi:hypothetical protein Tco_0680616 [Tanacetum coccineum]|uniref:Extensin-like n=1 Tax=Tanacetum coccineum TaxID=301880 RepID=A0ABQ4XLV4_9ASTR
MSNNSSPRRSFSPLSDYNAAPLSTPIDFPPITHLPPQTFSPSKLLTTPKTTPPPLTTPPPALTQPSKQSCPLTINLEPIELIFSTPPTSLHPYFNSLEDLPQRTTNPSPLLTFKSIKRISNQPPPILDITDMEPPPPPFPPHLPPLNQPMWSNDIPPPLPRKTFCEHYQRTQIIAHEVRDKM